MSDMSVQNSADEEINDHYSYRKNVQMQNSKKPKITMKAKPKKQKLIMVNTSDQNSDDEEIDELYNHRKNEQMQNSKKPETVIKPKPKKQKFQSHLLKLEQEYNGLTTMVNENCIRVKKSDGGNFCIKIPEIKTASDYLVIQKYKTSDMEKVESKDRWKTSTFNAKTMLNEKDKADNTILSAFNNLQDLLMDKFMCNNNKKIESYK
ncbi:uncharacterized protein LOC132935531 isoform X2 [Metopolophium dirhodum]|uniref:uncharacterized protein LOC132935531 isoform X2 n=2 Tax=Metopolophium dirhodum TaxID=44670 RepID=UPI00299063F9|nr:uncharacterized protein LOC132935531 isoform X2 [Metopolophium dirhodum]